MCRLSEVTISEGLRLSKSSFAVMGGVGGGGGRDVSSAVTGGSSGGGTSVSEESVGTEAENQRGVADEAPIQDFPYRADLVPTFRMALFASIMMAHLGTKMKNANGYKDLVYQESQTVQLRKQQN